MANLQPQMVHGQYNYPVIMNTQPQLSTQIARYARAFKILGILQVILGIGSIILAVVLIVIANSIYGYSYNRVIEHIAPGIWCGIFFLISGILGCVAATKQSSCPINGGIAMAVFSALAAIALMMLEVAAAIDSNYPYYPTYETYTDMTVLHSVLCIMAFAEFVIAITHSAYSCAASSCCCAGNSNAQVVVTTRNGNSMTYNTVLPGQMNTYSYVTTGNYNGNTNQPNVMVQSTNMTSIQGKTNDQPPKYEDLKNPL